MAKPQTPGVITLQEFQRAEKEGKFIISHKVVCAYCTKTVAINGNDKKFLYCPHHNYLKLSVETAPDYPAVPQEDHYKEMNFRLYRLYRSQTSDNEPRKYVARGKGCPFCDKYMIRVDYDWGERFDASLLNQRVLCADCEVHFHIKVFERKKWLEMRFVPEEKYLPELPDDSKALMRNTPIEHKIPVANLILKYLTENGGLGSTGKMIDAIGCSQQGFKNNVDKLIEEKKIKQVARGIYQLING